MEEHTSNDNNDSACQEKINSGDVSTNTSFSNYGKGKVFFYSSNIMTLSYNNYSYK